MQEQLPSVDPDKSAQRVERLEGGPQGERSELSSDCQLVCFWIPAFAGMTKYELISVTYAGSTRNFTTARSVASVTVNLNPASSMDSPSAGI